MADVKVVAPMNMGKGLTWNATPKQYEVALSKKSDNMLALNDDGLYLGATATRTAFYVDAVNGNDANDGTKNAPYKTVGKAINMVENNTLNTNIYLKEEQTHYLTAQSSNVGEFRKLAGYTLRPYGDKYDALKKDWESYHTGVKTYEPVEASAAYKAIQPTLKFRGSTVVVENDVNQGVRLEAIVIPRGYTVQILGIKLDTTGTDSVSYSSGGWYSSMFRGAGEVILLASTVVCKDTPNAHIYVAVSALGALEVSCRYLIIAGSGNLFSVAKNYPLHVNSSYDTVTDASVNESSLTKMKYKGVATAEQIFALTTNTNPKSFITNK